MYGAIKTKTIPGVCRAELHPCEEPSYPHWMMPEVRVLSVDPGYRFPPPDPGYHSLDRPLDPPFPADRDALDAHLREHPPDLMARLLFTPPAEHDYVIGLRCVRDGEEPSPGPENERDIGVVVVEQDRLDGEGITEETGWRLIEDITRRWRMFCNGQVYWMYVEAEEPRTNRDLWDDDMHHASEDLYDIEDNELDALLYELLPDCISAEVIAAHPWEPGRKEIY